MTRAARRAIETLGPLDSAFLHLEDGVNHMHIGACCIFDGPAPSEPELRVLVDAALDDVPRYRQRLRFVPGAIGPPVWVDDPGFRLGEHLHHATLHQEGRAAGEDRSALEVLVARLMSVELDRRRPLWDMWLVDGLDDGRWALISKAHHCMVDGVAGIGLLSTVLAGGSGGRGGGRTRIRRATPPVSGTALAVAAVRHMARRPAEVLVAAEGALVHPRRTAARAIDLVRGSASLAAVLLPSGQLSPRHAGDRPSSGTTGPIGPRRAWATSSVAIDDIRRVRALHGGTLNDVVLAAVAGAHRTLLLSRGDDPDAARLRTLVPVSLRAADDRRADNQVSAIVAELPIHLATPVERLDAVRTRMESLKHAHQTDAATAALGLAGDAPAALGPALRAMTWWLQHGGRLGVQTVTTNVPGPADPLSACGRPLREYLPFVPVYAGMRIGVAALSYVDRIAFGVTADADSVPQVAVLADAIPTEIESLLA